MSETMLLRPATHADARLLWEWRNDEVARQNAFETGPLDWDRHGAWLERKLGSSECRIWILEKDGCQVGQIRYERVADAADISFSVASRVRGQGFGTLLLKLSGARACRELGVSRVVGVVKDQNDASKKAFEGAGFNRTGSLLHNGHPCWRFERVCPESHGGITR